MALYLVTVNRKVRVVMEVDDAVDVNAAKEIPVSEAEAVIEAPNDSNCAVLSESQSTSVERLVPQPVEG